MLGSILLQSLRFAVKSERYLVDQNQLLPSSGDILIAQYTLLQEGEEIRLPRTF